MAQTGGNRCHRLSAVGECTRCLCVWDNRRTIQLGDDGSGSAGEPRVGEPEIGLLGPLAVWRGGHEINLGSPQQQAVLAVLALRRNETVSVDALVDALWSERPPATALQTVRTYISRLRQALTGLDGVRLASTASGYRLAVDFDRIDVDVFAALAEDGRVALTIGEAGRAEKLLTRALSLVRGRPLAGLENIPIARLEAEQLEELWLLVKEDLVESRLAQGRHRELVPALRAETGRYPYRERLWAQLMLALYRSGRQEEALAAYRTAREALQTSLGLEPGRELRTLERMILLQERTLEHELVGRLHAVPGFSTRLIGRDEQVAAVRSLVRRHRLVTLVGPAGVGKTRLAAEVAPALRRVFRGGVWWVDLGSVAPGGMARAVATALDMRAEVAELASRLRGERALVVLDNCEHLASEAAAFAVAVIAGTEAPHLLATSREALRVTGEQVVEVAPLSLPQPPALGEPAAGGDARQLLTELSGVLPRDREDERALAEIVIRLDGLPLAIELAARRLAQLKPRALAHVLATRLDVLGPGERTADSRQQTLQAALLWSFELLSSQEQLALMRLAPLRGSFDLEAAESLAAEGEIVRADVLPLLTELVDKSLVTIVPSDQPLYQLLTTVRLFAHEQSAARGELAGASRRHRDHYLSVAEDVARCMLGSQLAAGLPFARAQHDDLLAALTWSLDVEDGEAALQLASALAFYWFRVSQLADGRHLLGRALRLAPTTSSWRARGLVLDAFLACAARAEDAARVARSAVAACAERGDELEPFAWLALVVALLTPTAPSAAALAEAEQALAHAHLFPQSGDGEGAAVAEQLQGLLAFRRGELEPAYAHLVQARQMFRMLRGTLDAGWTLVQLAEVALALGDYVVARSAGTDAVGDFRARGDARGLAASFAVLGRVYRALGDDQRAEQLLTEGLRLARSHGYAPEEESLADALEGREAV